MNKNSYVDTDNPCHNPLSFSGDLVASLYIIWDSFCANIILQLTVLLNSRQQSPHLNLKYHKTSNISRTLVGNKIVDHSDVVGASPVGAAPPTSSFSTWHLASRDSAKKAARQYQNLLSVEIWWDLY